MIERQALTTAETIARELKRREVERTVAEFERSKDPTLRSLANVYRMLGRPLF